MTHQTDTSAKRPRTERLYRAISANRAGAELRRVLDPYDGFVMLDRGKRVVEVVEQRAPTLIFGRTAEALGVVLQSLPTSKQYVASRILDTALKVEVIEARHRGDDVLRVVERGLERCALSVADIENREFQDHPAHRTVVAADIVPNISAYISADRRRRRARGAGRIRLHDQSGHASPQREVRTGLAVDDATLDTVRMEGAFERPGELTARRAQLEDADPLASIMFLAPGREAVAMAGTAAAARHFTANLFRHALAAGTSSVIVAEIGAEPVGFAEVSRGGDMPSFEVVVRAAVDAMGLSGALRAAWRSRARSKVNMEPPEGGVHLAELQVSPRYRNHGAGAFLLGEVDRFATEARATHISLTTTTDNPARRLYERNGYRVIDQRTNDRYERITGSPGRVLMVKAMVDGVQRSG